MINLTNSHPLSDFQRNARSFIAGLNETKEPVLLTVNGKVQAVLVDPATYQKMAQELESERIRAALREGELAIQEGRVITAEQAFNQLKEKHGF